MCDTSGTHDHERETTSGTTRRATLSAAAGGVAAAVAGCLGDGTTAPDPISLAGSLQCDVCGMVIGKHPGPNGQVFFAENGPEGHDPPARFDSLKQCLFPYLMEREQLGWDPTAVYVTDYSAVDYDVTTDGGKTFISSHTTPESFALANDRYFVVESDVEGAMGPDFLPFSDEADARSFSDEYGGEVLRFDEIDESVVGK